MKIAQELPNLKQIPPKPQGHMPAPITSSDAVTIVTRHIEAGKLELPCADQHRIMVHASTATRTYCPQAQRHFIRRAGDIDVLPAGKEAGFEAETSFKALLVCLAPSLLDSVAAELGTATETIDTQHLLRDERIDHLVRALEWDNRTASTRTPLFADSIGVALAARLLGLKETTFERPGRLSERQLKRLLHHIDDHLDTALTLEALSKEAGVSSSHLRTWFKAATGMTVHRYVLRRRLERARTLLLEGRLSVSEVAYRTGFSHQSHLAHWMQRELGQTPHRLRRAQSLS